MWTLPNKPCCKTPFLRYYATGKTICRRCLELDGFCFKWEDAEAIEATLSCGCPHEWMTFDAENNSPVDDHARAGWTVGLSASGVPCLELCPPELLALVEKQRAATTAYEIEAAKIEALFNGPPRDDIAPDEVAFWHNVKMSEGAPFQEAMRQKNRADRAVWNYVENVLRVSQGLPKVGEGWVNEMRLYRAVEVLFPDDEVIHHYRADWLGRLELDVYVVQANIAFEYQGIQHYEPLDHWGGEEALERNQERDAEKSRRCATHGTPLVEVKYTEKVSVDLVTDKLRRLDLLE